jgi:hypothetical protein
MRESASKGFDGRLFAARRELAWLLDRGGDPAAAETLLRRNVEARGAPQGRAAALSDLAWFLIAHQQPQQAESLLTGSATAEGEASSGEADQLRIALAWARLLQGRAEEGTSVLKGIWRHPDPSAGVAAKLDLALDLAAASRLHGDAAGEAEWLERGRSEIRKLPAESAEDLRSRYQGPAQSWDAVRRQKHGELAGLL